MLDISVYRRNHDGVIYCVKEFDDIKQLFSTIYPFSLVRSHFSNSLNDRFKGHPFDWDVAKVRDREWLYNLHYSYVAFDSNDKLICVDRLVGLFRQYRRERAIEWEKRFPHRWYPGSKRHSNRSSYYRRLKTTQERRQFFAGTEEEFAPSIRGRRSARVLPHSWCDYPRSDIRDRSWKRHRSHQWKDI